MNWFFSSLFQLFTNVIYTGASITVGCLVLIYFQQRRLIYVSYVPADARTNVAEPKEFMTDAVFETVWLKTEDNVQLHAYFIHGQEFIDDWTRIDMDSNGNENDKLPCLLVFHANAGNMGHRLPLMAYLRRSLMDSKGRFPHIFMLSYRGFGKSTGTPTQQGLIMDAETALNYLFNKQDASIDHERICLYGQSLGGAVALALASKYPEKISTLILENTFLSLPRLIPHVMPWLTYFTWLCHDPWYSEQALKIYLKERRRKQLKVKILLLSGRKDELIPSAHMDTFFELITMQSCPLENGCETEECWIKYFKNGTHNDTCVQPGYFDVIRSFFEHFHLL